MLAAFLWHVYAFDFSEKDCFQQCSVISLLLCLQKRVFCKMVGRAGFEPATSAA